MNEELTVREIFRRCLSFESAPRLPRVEWAAWWDKTYNRWEQKEGLQKGLGFVGSQQYFGLDVMHVYAFAPPEKRITCMADYEALRPQIFNRDSFKGALRRANGLKEAHERGDILIRGWFDGFFWFARKLLGIEPHLFAFYDQPELLHRINQDLLDFYLEFMPQLFAVIRPDFCALGEDMSYNLGPMLSKEQFDEFLRPYYLPFAEMLHRHNVPFFVDSDGLVDMLIPWLLDANVDGIFPLERQAGVDVNALRQKYPKLIMLGGYDKMVMSKGEEAMKKEFERLLPAMRSGGYVPSVDHQTPPEVSLENYRIYIQLFHEYTERARSSL
jgi:uroporphyrinogen-III decarboxylase